MLYNSTLANILPLSASYTIAGVGVVVVVVTKGCVATLAFLLQLAVYNTI